MDELIEQFLIEGRELVAQAHRDFDLLSGGGGGAALDSAFRAIHTLKGSVAIFDMKPAERVLHGAEDQLDAARKAGIVPSREAIETLVALLDQVDRWIDEIERAGSLGPDAPLTADRLLARLRGEREPAAPPSPSSSSGWLEELRSRAAAVLAGADEGLVAFRYAPAPDCFFRGDDPLAIIGALPGLQALAILPVASWPSLDQWDPFRCTTVLEGICTGPIDAAAAAFRLVADQVELAPLPPGVALPESTGTGAGATLRIDSARIDALADQLAELVVATSALAPLAEQASGRDRALGTRLRAAQAEIERVAGSIHRAASAMRLVSLAPAFRRFPRLVREVAEEVGKPVRFALSGEATEIDKAVADALHEPLLHLLRNAIDHGIEDAPTRREAGKPAEGTLRLSARREGNRVVIQLSDDGGGMDPARIRAVAVARGVIPAGQAEPLSDAQALRLIFLPGISTAGTVTDLSGRGVGMDAVKTAVERHRGTIEIDSRAGEGTTIRLLFPVQSLTTPLLVVCAGEERFGIPFDQIAETVQIEPEQLIAVGGGTACVLRDRTVPVLALADLLGLEPDPGETVRLVVTRMGGEPVALRVDGYERRVDAIVRPRSGLLARVPGVFGTAVLGDGGVLIVLDLAELAA